MTYISRLLFPRDTTRDIKPGHSFYILRALQSACNISPFARLEILASQLLQIQQLEHKPEIGVDHVTSNSPSESHLGKSSASIIQFYLPSLSIGHSRHLAPYTVTATNYSDLLSLFLSYWSEPALLCGSLRTSYSSNLPMFVRSHRRLESISGAWHSTAKGLSLATACRIFAFNALTSRHSQNRPQTIGSHAIAVSGRHNDHGCAGSSPLAVRTTEDISQAPGLTCGAFVSV